MRISADYKDPHYSPTARRCDVFLNGEFVDHVVMADEERGLILQLAVNAGRPERCVCGERFVKHLRFGHVRISIRPNCSSNPS
jgi:hypothetical protein